MLSFHFASIVRSRRKGPHSTRRKEILILTPNWVAMYWWLRDKGNIIFMPAFEKLTVEQVNSNFKSPTSKSVIDPELVKAFSELQKGEGLKFQKDEALGSRKLKVRVGKAAAEAKRVLEWSELEDGFIARVVEVKASSNGVVTPPTTPATETPAASGGSRRNS